MLARSCCLISAAACVALRRCHTHKKSLCTKAEALWLASVWTGKKESVVRQALKVCACAAASAVMFTTRRTVAEGVSTWAAALAPIKMGPMVVP